MYFITHEISIFNIVLLLLLTLMYYCMFKTKSNGIENNALQSLFHSLGNIIRVNFTLNTSDSLVLPSLVCVSGIAQEVVNDFSYKKRQHFQTD